MCPRPRCNWKLDIYDEWQSFLIIRCCIPIIMEAIIVIDWPRRRDIVSQFTPLILRQFCIFRGMCNYSTQHCRIGMKAFTPHWNIMMPLQFIVIVHLQRFELKSVALDIYPFLFQELWVSPKATRPQLSRLLPRSCSNFNFPIFTLNVKSMVCIKANFQTFQKPLTSNKNVHHCLHHLVQFLSAPQLSMNNSKLVQVKYWPC